MRLSEASGGGRESHPPACSHAPRMLETRLQAGPVRSLTLVRQRSRPCGLASEEKPSRSRTLEWIPGPSHSWVIPVTRRGDDFNPSGTYASPVRAWGRLVDEIRRAPPGLIDALIGAGVFAVGAIELFSP